jgi:multidrug efflux pump subunit AcrA (membrane-fusion protein)
MSQEFIKKIMSQKFIALVVIVVVVLCGGIYAFRQLVPASSGNAEGPVYATQEVIRGDISVGVNTTGMLNPTRGGGIRVPGEMRYDGGVSIQYMLDEILVEPGDEVQTGQVLARLVSYDLESQLDQKQTQLEAKVDEICEMTGVEPSQVDSIVPSKGITLRAPTDGRLIGFGTREGDELELGQIIGRVVDDSMYRVRTKLYPAEIQNVHTGQKVLMKFLRFEGFMEAEVTQVNRNPVPDDERSGTSTGYVYWITVEGNNPGLVQPGMEVRIGLPNDEQRTNIMFFRNTPTVEGYIKEESIINRAKAIVTEVYAHDMQAIEKGDPILSMSGTDVQETLQDLMEEIRELKVELRNLQNQFDQLDITASMDGVVASINRQEGETVRAGEWIGDIYNTTEMMLWAQVDDIDIVNVKQDAPVRVTVDAVPGEVYEGKVTHVSPMGEKINNITRFSINMTIKGGPQLRPGMQANGFIDAGSAEDVLLIPLEAVFEDDGRTAVEVLDEDGSVRMVQVRLGLMNDRFAEVVDGLEEGQLVITGSSADLLPSQQIKATDRLLPEKSEDNNEN